MLHRAIGLIAIFASMVSATITNCGTSQSVFTIDSLSLTPENPVSGDIATMMIGFDAPMSVSAGTATYTLSLNGLPFSQQQDLCAATTCPIAAGHNTVVSNITIPSNVAGTIAAKIEWSDATGQELMCVKVKETLQSKALVVYDFVLPYSPHYLTSAAYVDTIESMHFFLDDYAEFNASFVDDVNDANYANLMNDTMVAIVPKKTHLRGSTTTGSSKSTSSTGSTSTTTGTSSGNVTTATTQTSSDNSTTGNSESSSSSKAVSLRVRYRRH